MSDTTLMKGVVCWMCSVEFFISACLMQRLRETGDTFYCPAGHKLVFRPSEAERLKKRLAVAEAAVRWHKSTGYALRRSNAALRGVITKMRKAREDLVEKLKGAE